jgi:serine protease Do
VLGTLQLRGKDNPPPKLNVQEAPIGGETKATTSFAPVIKKVTPSVVNIYSTKTIRQRQMPLQFFDPFGLFGDESDSPRRRPRTQRAQSLGSGVIVSSDGYILTANHVVEGADEVKVALASGGKEFTAKVVGTDPPTDVAVLKVEGSGLPAITLTDSDKLEVGDTVLAIGNPFGVGQTVTMGIISGTGRGGFGIVDYEDFIQTDAAINPGNSGGALVDAEGRLVGINTAIISGSGGNQGVGFAVPINLARGVMDRIIKTGKFTRGLLGVIIGEITPDVATHFGLPDHTGALVEEVQPGTPAEKAGLKEGDAITEFNGKKVSDQRNLRLTVAQTPPGTKVNLKILRSEPGKKPVEKTVTATLGELKPEELAAARERGGRPGKQSESGMDALDGVEVTDLESRTRRQLGIAPRIEGALITNVDSDSRAAEAGLRAGDVILEINRQAVHNADEAVELSHKAKGDTVLLRVWSRGAGGGGTHYVAVKTDKAR